MPNKISFSGTPQNNSLRKGNVNLGINDVEYGPTDNTGFWNGWDVPNGGYVIYKKSNINSPLIYVIENPYEITNYAKEIGCDETTLEGLLEWATTQDDILIVNKNYEDIVTDGLVLNLDAGFTGSYPKSGNTWYDVSVDGNSGMLVNGPEFSEEGGGSIVFDGVDDRVMISSPEFAVGQGNFTLEVWCYRDPITSNTSSGIVASTSSNQIGIALTDRSCWIGTTSFSQIIGNNTTKNFPDNEWFHAAFRRSNDGKTLSLKLNGVDRFTPTTSETAAMVISQTFALAQRYNNIFNFPLGGKISNVRFYNRDLSDQEILQNYNATKGRFTFTFTINTANTSTGSSDSDQFTLPLVNTGEYNMVVDWGDGTTDTITSYNQAEITHTYATTGETEINIFGLCKGFRFNNGGDKLKMLDIKNWGCLDINTDSSFYGCQNMTCSAGDSPIISSTSLSSTFRNCYEFDGKIGNWDVSNVNNMSAMFMGLVGQPTKFNQPIGSWDVSSVTNMGNMFNFNTYFDQPIGNWDVSSVTNMTLMFGGLYNTRSVFNQDIGNWDVSNVTSMSSMFTWSSKFNNGGSNSINNWDTSNVVGPLYFMFYGSPFNQPIGNWVVSGVTSLSFTLGYCSFNQDISNWDVSNVTEMSGLFFLSPFNQDILNWNVSSVTDMSRMFESNVQFNQDISNWNVSGVTNMSKMFYNSDGFDQDISSWDINQVTNFNDFMILATGLSTENYDAILVGWESQTPQSNITINFGGSQYTLGSAAATARQSLIDNFNWTITDGGGI